MKASAKPSSLKAYHRLKVHERLAVIEHLIEHIEQIGAASSVAWQIEDIVRLARAELIGLRERDLRSPSAGYASWLMLEALEKVSAYIEGASDAMVGLLTWGIYTLGRVHEIRKQASSIAHRGAMAAHEETNQMKSEALAWFRENRSFYSKNEAADALAKQFPVARETCRRWLRHV